MIQKLNFLNETILDHLDEENEIKIFKAFTEAGIKILGADFGFVWLKQPLQKEWVLVYKSANLPFQPNKPRLGGINHQAMIHGKIEYIKKFKSTPYDSDAGRYMKSFVIIPISYKGKAYGTIVVCFKKSESFLPEKKVLSAFLGNGIAQVMTIRRSREKAKHLKETQMLLSQEKSKTGFIANAAHELRTPLAIIRGNVDLALAGNDRHETRPAHGALKAIQGEVEHLSEILTSLVILTSQNGPHKNMVHFDQVDLISVIRQTIRRLHVLIRKNGITVKLTTHNLKRLSVMGDKPYLEKLFINLIRNAIIYGKDKKGKIWIDVNREKNKIVIQIADDGIGISKKDLPHVFERFYRSEQAWRTTTIGTGLGLSVAKWAAEAHGGTISVTSVEGKGSVFTVSLPIQKK